MLKTKKQGRPLYRDCLGYMGVSEQTTGASGRPLYRDLFTNEENH